MTRTVEERSEIERHKYLLSERMGYDVGWRFAEKDWDENHATDWRRCRANLSNQDADAESVASSKSLEPGNADTPPLAGSCTEPAEHGGWLKGLLRRFRF